jgi:hypothetical protein
MTTSVLMNTGVLRIRVPITLFFLFVFRHIVIVPAPYPAHILVGGEAVGDWTLPRLALDDNRLACSLVELETGCASRDTAVIALLLEVLRTISVFLLDPCSRLLDTLHGVCFGLLLDLTSDGRVSVCQ